MIGFLESGNQPYFRKSRDTILAYWRNIFNQIFSCFLSIATNQWIDEKLWLYPCFSKISNDSLQMRFIWDFNFFLVSKHLFFQTFLNPPMVFHILGCQYTLVSCFWTLKLCFLQSNSRNFFYCRQNQNLFWI